MDYSRDYDELRHNLYKEFNSESIEIVMGLQSGNHTRVRDGVLAIFWKYQQQKKEITQLKADNQHLKEALEQCKKELGHQQHKVTPPARRDDIDDAEMYRVYKKFGSFRAVGRLFNCEGKTVKERLKKGGYI